MIQDEDFRGRVRASVRADPCKPNKLSYDYTLSEQRQHKRSRGKQRQPLPELRSMRSSLSRAKREVPNIPRNIERRKYH